MPAEVLFYHLERLPLDQVLPTLVEKTLERGWRAVIQSGTAERMETLNTVLWSFRADSFIPHGTPQDGMSSDQPVYLTTGAENPNGAQVRFFVEGAAPAEWEGYARIVILFDGRDSEAVTAARQQWKGAKTAGASVAYWQQNGESRWERKA